MSTTSACASGRRRYEYQESQWLLESLTRCQNLAVLGHYDLWVKRGVVSLMGAKLHPSPRLYRVYAPSTHSLPVVKCVSGVNGDAEVEIRSCRSGIYRLRDLSPLYQRIWNDESTPSDKLTFKGVSGKSKRTFSLVCYSSHACFGSLQISELTTFRCTRRQMIL